jgi:hypothetical protein
MPSKTQARTPRLYTIPVRVLLITFIGTLIVFAVSLFVGIVGTISVSAVRHVNPQMTVAYRHIALPVAMVAGCIVFVSMLVMEIRHYRQSRTLAAIERAS